MQRTGSRNSLDNRIVDNVISSPRISNNQTRRSVGWLALAVLAAAGLCAAPALRADPQGGGRAIRLSSVDGHVRVTEGNQVLAEQASVNTPLFEGMQITTVDDGRAEIQFEDGSVARLSPDSSLTLTVLRGEGAGGDAEMTLNGGLAYFELQGGNQSGQMSVQFADTTATASGFTVPKSERKVPGSVVAPVFTWP